MTNKKLKAHTIIPQSLYVERAADRQVKDILEDMGRPGYVLVARQMGKTNLLLNAKRRFSSKDDIFSYLDVSNPFPDIQSFFRNIIDAIVDQLSNVFPALIGEIFARRAGSKLLPHKEHELELRIILKKISGKLVICLDEIDALTKTDYSDQAFSLIRSIYFSGRANFEEFSRLNYLLSGVAEPSDIIKNKEISPFNIGEKIYLDDFSIQEFYDFLSKARLEFDPSVVQAIYEWTRGNPRITWDVCSAVEDLTIEKGEVSSNDVSTIIQKLYLTHFDLPPIDHIRKLVEEDKDIRSAIMSIHYDRSETISDPLRNRLYLSGICSFASDSRKISIKNKIISLSLSDSWIDQVDREKLSLDKVAKQYFDAGNYAAAKSVYLELLGKTTDNVDKSIPYYYLGLCYFKMDDFINAIDYLERQPIKKTYSPALYLNSLTILALSNFQLGKFKEAKNLFEQVVAGTDKKEDSFNYYQAKVSYGSALWNFNADLVDDAISSWQEVIEHSNGLIVESKLNDAWRDLNSLAKSNIAQSFISLDRIDEAKIYLKDAIAISSDSFRAERLLMLSKIESVQIDSIDYLVKSARCVIDNCVIVSKFNDHNSGFNPRAFLALIQELFSHKENSLLRELLNYMAENYERQKSNFMEIIERLISIFMELGAISDIQYFLSVVNENQALSMEVKRITLAFLIVLKQGDALIYQDGYIKSLAALEYVAKPYDVAALFIVISYSIAAKLYSKVSEGIEILDNLVWEESPPIGTYLIADYLRVLSMLRQFPSAESYLFASKFLNNLKEKNSIKIPFFSEKFSVTMDNSVRSEMYRIPTHQVVREERKIGRNENVIVRYDNGKIVANKYKYLVEDIEKKKCVIISA